MAHFAGAALGAFAFVIALFGGAIVLPGFTRLGQPEPGAIEGHPTRRRYKLSGLVLFGTTTGLTLLWLATGHTLVPILEHFVALFAAANILALAVSAALIVGAWRRGHGSLVENASSGRGRLRRALLDIWLGAEKHPTWFGVDLKMFAYHPSLIGLGLINASFASAQFQKYGALSHEMVLYQAFTWSYLATHYVREDFMLSTWDIIAEKFGFMLVWGDLVYVPFFYSLAGWWVVDAGMAPGSEGLGVVGLSAIAALHLFSHWMFRTANWQKHAFKRDPNARIWGRPAEALEGRILISGWWGIGRKLNYTGEIGVYLSFALCAGFDAWTPYVLPASLVVLLVQRAWRDDRRCRQKYGRLWTEYCARARFKMFPFVY